MNDPIIQLRRITKDYKLGTLIIPALRMIDLDIFKKEYVALMGPSGSGKSTLMNIIGCLDVATEGEYILNSKNVGNLTENELAEIRNKEIGFVFQTFNLLPRLNAIENVALPLVYAGIGSSERNEVATEMLESVGLLDRMKHKPSELSGGQRQRVAIARALVNRPSIILADEPTGNLDSKTSEEIMDIFTAINEAGNTVIIVTHEDDIAKKTKREIRLIDGMINSDNLNNTK